MTLTIREGTSDDVEAALALYERSNMARRGGDWPEREDRLRRKRELLDSAGSWFLVGFDADQIVTVAIADPYYSSDGTGPPLAGACFLNWISVAPERWGQGVGAAMLDAFLADAHSRGYHRVYLHTNPNNERSQRLYASRGFEPTGASFEHSREWARSL